MSKSTTLSILAEKALGLDHVAVAVPDLKAAIAHYEKMGFTNKEERRTEGQFTGMVSAVMKAGPLTLVLVQGTSEKSQVTRYVDNFGAGVQHLAIEVKDLRSVAKQLEAEGVEFDTTVIEGDGIRQIFTRRDPASGMMYELIERDDDRGHFSDESVAELFRQLEENDAY